MSMASELFLERLMSLEPAEEVVKDGWTGDAMVEDWMTSLAQNVGGGDDQ